MSNIEGSIPHSEEKYNMNVLICGGAGFIGSHIIEKMLEDTNITSIMSYDNYHTGTTTNHHEHKKVRYVYGDTVNINLNQDVLIFKPDIVIHLAEYSRIVPSFDEIQKCHQHNTLGTFQVLEFCRKNGAKLVYSGSSSKFGNDGADEHLSPYAWMKAKNIELIKNYHNWFGLNYVIGYFFNVYGPRQITKGSYATVIGIFQEQYLAKQPLTIVGNGLQERDLTHVDDAARGLIAAALKGHNDEYMLGYGQKRRIIDVAKAFDHPIIHVPERKGERLSGQSMSEKARKELGWQAEIDVIEYIKEWVKAQSPEL